MGKRVLLGAGGLAVAASLALFGFSSRATSTDYTFIARGIVTGSTSDAKIVKVYFTYATGNAKDDLLGNVIEVKTSPTKVYAWTKDAKGVLYKKRVVRTQLTAGKEVVIRGTKRGEDSYTAAWAVINYRKFSIEGTLAGLTRDAGTADEGWVTVKVTKSDYKQAAILGKEVRMRINGTSAISSLGKVKGFNDVTAADQKVRVEGEVHNSSSYVISKFTELN